MPRIIASISVVVALFALLLPLSLRAGAASPVGIWRTIDDETGQARALIEIRERGGVLEGRIVALFRNADEEPNPRCSRCNGAQHNQPVIGMTILTGLKHDGDIWDDGEILDPNNGKVYRCKIATIDGGRKLDVRGFIGISLFGRTQVWEREQ